MAGEGRASAARHEVPEEQGTTILVSAKSPVQMTVNLRIPYWVHGGNVKINGTLLPAFASPASYLSLSRVWKNGDKIEVSLPMDLHLASMPDDESVQVVMYGPLVLAGRFEPVVKDLMYGDCQPKPGDQYKVSEIVAEPGKPAAWVEPDGKQPLTFRRVGQSQEITMVPLCRVIHERYAVYWKVNNRST